MYLVKSYGFDTKCEIKSFGMVIQMIEVKAIGFICLQPFKLWIKPHALLVSNEPYATNLITVYTGW